MKLNVVIAGFLVGVLGCEGHRGCERYTAVLADKAEECSIEVPQPEMDLSSCTPEEDALVECPADCFEAVTCDALAGNDSQNVEEYKACLDDCPGVE